MSSVATRPAAEQATEQNTGGGRRPSRFNPLKLAKWMAPVVVLLVGLVGVAAFVMPRTTDHSSPVLLQSVQDIGRYHAVTGTYHVTVDLEHDRRWTPDFLDSRRTALDAHGTVDWYVDFTNLTEDAVTMSADGTTAEIRLPAPQIGETNLDIDNSRILDEDRGFGQWLHDAFAQDPDRQREVYQLAESKIAEASRQEDLSGRAQENTRKMLEGLARSLGVEHVTVTFAGSEASPSEAA